MDPEGGQALTLYDAPDAEHAAEAGLLPALTGSFGTLGGALGDATAKGQAAACQIIPKFPGP